MSSLYHSRWLACILASLVAARLIASAEETYKETPEAPLLSEALLAQYPAACPEDAVTFGDSRYKVFADEERTLTWHQKKALCEHMGGHLAVIETPAEHAFITKLADERYLSLGATDEAEEGTWRWVNGAPWNPEPNQWLKRQPNNYAQEEHYLATFDDGLWVDVAATGYDWWLPTGFICEWEIKEPPAEADNLGSQ